MIGLEYTSVSSNLLQSYLGLDTVVNHSCNHIRGGGLSRSLRWAIVRCVMIRRFGKLSTAAPTRQHKLLWTFPPQRDREYPA